MILGVRKIFGISIFNIHLELRNEENFFILKHMEKGITFATFVFDS